MTRAEFYVEVGTAMGYLASDDSFITALETSCVTEAEWISDRHGCKARIRGALEEQSVPEDWNWQNDFNYVGSRHHY